MTHKFKETIGDKLKNMNKDMISAREQKRKELEKKYIPNSVRDVLTPEEVERSSTIGIVLGLAILLCIIIAVVGWLFL